MSRLGCVAQGLAPGLAAAAAMTRAGQPSTVLCGIPGEADLPGPATPLVVCINDAGDAARAAAWLREAGCDRFVYVHDTMFSDDAIGAALDALVDALGCGFALLCAATPAAGVTVYQGHLFRRDGLRKGEANLVRVLGAQTDATVGLIAWPVVAAGSAAVRRAATGCKEQGRRYGLADALTPADMAVIAAAGRQQTVLAGTPAMAAAVAADQMDQGGAAAMPPILDMPGGSAALVVSTARTTLFQLGQVSGRLPVLALDATAADAAGLATAARLWALQEGAGPIVIALTPSPDDWRRLTLRLGEAAARALLWDAAAAIAVGLRASGRTRLLLAGEMAVAAVIGALQVQRLTLGQEIDPGVNWMQAEGAGAALLLAVKPDEAGGAGVIAGAFERLPA